MITIPSSHSVPTTVARIKQLLSKKAIHVFADIDHAAEALEARQLLRPTRLLVFGDPKAGTPLMQSEQTIGLDLPLRTLVWEDEKGKVWVAYHRPSVLAKNHHIVDKGAALKALDAGLTALTRMAASDEIVEISI